MTKDALKERPAIDVALHRDHARARPRAHRHARRGMDAAADDGGARAAHRPGQCLGEGREPQSDGQFQGSRPRCGGRARARTRRHGGRHPLGGQRRLGDVRLRGARRDGGLRLHAAGYAGRDEGGERGLRRARLPRRWPDQRLRRDHPPAERAARLVRRLDPQGAVPRRREEDARPRTRRATRLARAGRHHLPDRRRHGHRRHVEGVRGTGSDGADRPGATEDGRRPGGGVRADRPRLRAAASATPRSGRTPTPSRPACACRSPSATT